MNFVTAPLIADLFLLAILAIGREEVRAGTLGADHISPLDIMLFFITLAYIAISIDASGLIRWLAYKVLLWGGKSGYKLFFYLYTFFSLLGGFIGNDPIILSGTPFLAYLTRVSSNIQHPKAWIFTQFSVANIVSAVLVSSNPTNLVLAGAFQIKFLDYTVNMIVPVVFTIIILFPFLLCVIFKDEKLIPKSITIHQLPLEVYSRPRTNPCIPFAKGAADEQDTAYASDENKVLELVEIMHPFLDKKAAIFGSLLMAATLITVLALNTANPTDGELPVFWVTLPAAVVMLCWDVTFGFLRRQESRDIARRGRREFERVRAEGLMRGRQAGAEGPPPAGLQQNIELEQKSPTRPGRDIDALVRGSGGVGPVGEREGDNDVRAQPRNDTSDSIERSPHGDERNDTPAPEGTTLVSLVAGSWAWMRETFPTATFVLAHLPLALIPFAFAMFVLVQALVTKGWVPVFAYGWDHWVNATGTVGAVGGMAFVSVILCNVRELPSFFRPSCLLVRLLD